MPRRNRPFALTVLSPLAGGRSEGAAHAAAAIRRILAKLPTGSSSPLARIPTLHFARWVVIDDVRSQEPPAREEHLRSMYLLFAADFDGELPMFLGDLLAKAGDLVESLWRDCVGFPRNTSNADFNCYKAAFTSYIEYCRLIFSLSIGAYPNSSLPEVLKALEVQRVMVKFIESTQGKPATVLRRAFRDFMQDVRYAPVPPGGWA